MKKNKTYKAQALAIIMIILVVASIIGFSVFSRLMTQKRAAVQERNSSEALEVADMILTNLLLSEPEAWIQKMVRDNLYKEALDSTQITQITNSLGHKLDLQNLNICPLSQGGNQYTLQLSRTNENTEFALRPGETFVFPIWGTNFGSNCKINITFSNNKTATGGFTVNKIYREADGSIKGYEYDNTKNYCFSNNPTVCSNSSFPSTPNGWTIFTTNPLSITIDTMLDRIQLTAIGQEILFKFSMDNTCEAKIELWQLRASATCSNTYRAKEVIVPDVGWNYSIFNYVFFNGLGNISSGQ